MTEHWNSKHRQTVISVDCAEYEQCSIMTLPVPSYFGLDLSSVLWSKRVGLHEFDVKFATADKAYICLLYTSPSPRD